jgi:hypothetical protein
MAWADRGGGGPGSGLRRAMFKPSSGGGVNIHREVPDINAILRVETSQFLNPGKPMRGFSRRLNAERTRKSARVAGEAP